MYIYEFDPDKFYHHVTMINTIGAEWKGKLTQQNRISLDNEINVGFQSQAIGANVQQAEKCNCRLFVVV